MTHLLSKILVLSLLPSAWGESKLRRKTAQFSDEGFYALDLDPALSNGAGNDSCDGATAIKPGPHVVAGDLQYSTTDTVYLTLTDPCCSTQTYIGGVGRWYTFVGNGLDMTFKSVTSGTGSIGTPLVLAGDSCSEMTSGSATAVNGDTFASSVWNTFQTNLNLQYWVLVYISYDSGLVDYDQGYWETPEPYTFTLTSQAYCEGASELKGKASNMLAFGEVADSLPACGSASAPKSKGVWYSITGMDKSYKLSTEGSRNLNTQLSVFEGECGNLSCTAGNDNYQYTYDEHSVVQFVGKKDVTYSILVHSATENAMGFFELSVEEYPMNDIPQGAPELTFDVPTQGSTVGATSEEYSQLGGGSCGYGINDAPAVYYKLSPAASGTSVEVAVESSDMESPCVYVLEGDIDHLNCLPGSFGECQPSSTWEAEEVVTYYILVLGSRDGGDFTLTATKS